MDEVLHSNERYRIRSRSQTSGNRVRVQIIREVIDRFRNRPDSKRANVAGEPSGSHGGSGVGDRRVRRPNPAHMSSGAKRKNSSPNLQKVSVSTGHRTPGETRDDRGDWGESNAEAMPYKSPSLRGSAGTTRGT